MRDFRDFIAVSGCVAVLIVCTIIVFVAINTCENKQIKKDNTTI